MLEAPLPDAVRRGHAPNLGGGHQSDAPTVNSRTGSSTPFRAAGSRSLNKVRLPATNSRTTFVQTISPAAAWSVRRAAGLDRRAVEVVLLGDGFARVDADLHPEVGVGEVGHGLLDRLGTVEAVGGGGETRHDAVAGVLDLVAVMGGEGGADDVVVSPNQVLFLRVGIPRSVARIELSGASSGTVTVTRMIERVDLSGASSLTYYGDPVLDDVSTSGASSIGKG